MNSNNKELNDLALILQKLLTNINYPSKITTNMLIIGNSEIYLPLIHYSIFNYSENVKNFLLEKNIDMYTKNDIEFIEKIFQILKNLFNYKPPFSCNQFFKNGYSYEKILFCINIIDLVQKKNNELINKKSSKQITDEDKNNNNCTNYNISNFYECKTNSENVINSFEEITTNYSQKMENKKNDNNININNDDNVINSLSNKYISLINVIESLKESVINMISKVDNFKDITEKRLNNLEIQVNLLNSRQNFIENFLYLNNNFQNKIYNTTLLNNNLINNNKMNNYKIENEENTINNLNNEEFDEVK